MDNRRTALFVKTAGTAFIFVFAVVILAGWPSYKLSAQSSVPARGSVVGTGVFTSFVENMDRSLAFYRDAFGMDVPAMPASGARPYNQPNPQLFAMFQIKGAKERHQSARVPGTRLAIEFMEIQDVDHKTMQLRIQDPGVVTPVLVVLDITSALAKVKQANATIITPGGAPVRLKDGRLGVLVRDVDGRPVQLVQAATAPTTTDSATAGATGNIVDFSLAITVNDLDQTMRIYRDVLGFAVTSPGSNAGDFGFAVTSAISNDESIRALTGLDKATIRQGRVIAPGSTLPLEFLEFKGVDRSPLKMRIQDRGASRLQVRAQNIDALVLALKAAGLSVVSEGGVAVPIPPNFKGALVADPNNFFLTPFEACDACAPTIAQRP